MAPSVSAMEGRCRKQAKDDGFCHNPHTPQWFVVEPPKVAVLRFALNNQRMTDEAERLGFEPRRQSEYTLRHRRELEGSLLQRSLNVGTPAKGNGCNVFGSKPLTRAVGFNLLANELEDNGFDLDGSVHAERNMGEDGEGVLKLVVRFRHKSIAEGALPRQEVVNTEAHLLFLRDIMRKNEWRANVFDNIPRYYVCTEGFIFQFQLLGDAPKGECDHTVKVLMLNPAEGEMEVAPEFFNRAIRFSTSVITCRVPHSYVDPPTPDMVKIQYDGGSWALRYALSPRWKEARSRR